MQRWVKLEIPCFLMLIVNPCTYLPSWFKHSYSVSASAVVDVKSLHSPFHSLAVMPQWLGAFEMAETLLYSPLSCKNDQKYKIRGEATVAIPLQAQEHPNQSMSLSDEDWCFHLNELLVLLLASEYELTLS